MDRTLLLKHRARRHVETLVYVGGIGVLLVTSSWLIAGLAGAIWVVAVSVLALVLGARLPVQVVLRLRGARPLHFSEAPRLFWMVRALSQRARLAMPRLFFIPAPMPQALTAYSGGEAGVAVTAGLLRLLDEDELSGVIAHELSHIKSGDTRVMALAQVMRRLTRAMALFGWVLLVANTFAVLLGAEPVSLLAVPVLVAAPLLSLFAELRLSRTRELDADLGAVALTGRPLALASALLKVEASEARALRRGARVEGFASVPRALRSHPDTRERVRRLMDLAAAPKRRRQPWGLDRFAPADGP